MRKKIFITILAFVLAIIAVFCYFQTGGKNSENQVSVYINDFELILDLEGETNIYNATQLTTEFANTFVVEDSYDYVVEINGQKISDGEEIEIELDALTTDSYISIDITTEEGTLEFLVRTLHEDINFTVEGESDSGYYYFDYNNAAVKTDCAGNVVFYKYTDFIRNFKRYEIDGVVYYGYLERAEEGTYDNIDVDGCAHMRLVVLDEYYNEIDSVEYLLTDNGIEDNHSIENHDYQILDLGHYIVTSYVAQDVDNVPEDLTEDGTSNAQVAAAVFQEIKDGELVFEFNSTDYPELYELSMDEDRNNYGADNYEDYVHMNSVIVDPSDDNYIVSLRSMNAIIKLDAETGEILWILGGEGDMFGISDEEQFSKQHYATISLTGSLTIYDNGVDNEQSRILEFVLDEETYEIVESNIYEIDGYYGSIRGSTTRLSDEEDIFLSAWGHTQDNNAIITEYNFTTDEMIIEFYDETGGECKNYRVHKYDN